MSNVSACGCHVSGLRYFRHPTPVAIKISVGVSLDTWMGGRQEGSGLRSPNRESVLGYLSISVSAVAAPLLSYLPDNPCCQSPSSTDLSVHSPEPDPPT